MAKSNKKSKSIKKEAIVLPELKNEIYMPCEWVIQFDNDEPQIFATADENSGDPEVMIKLRNTSESHLTFTDTAKNKKFSIYARPKKS